MLNTGGLNVLDHFRFRYPQKQSTLYWTEIQISQCCDQNDQPCSLIEQAFVVECGPFRFFCVWSQALKEIIYCVFGGKLPLNLTKDLWDVLEQSTASQTTSTNINAWPLWHFCVWKGGNVKPCETGSCYSSKWRTSFLLHVNGFDIK